MTQEGEVPAMRHDLKVIDDLGAAVGQRWAQLQSSCIAATGSFTYAIPLSSTPLPIYKWVINNSHDFPDWSATRLVLMDEQVEHDGSGSFWYIDRDDQASYNRFAEENFLKPLGDVLGLEAPLTIIKPDLDSLGSFDPALDMLVLAIGIDGNYANVMPGTSLTEGWHVTKLSPAFQQIHTAPSSESYSNAVFRDYGMSLGPRQVLNADQVIVIASGARKHDLFQRLTQLDAPDPSFPLSIIHDPAMSGRVSLYVTPDVL
jgi:6-phosphogluconolactonase/glucosamine-6-phosphate isomerase/deaminase